MRFKRSPLKFEQRPLTPRRLAAARRALERQAAALPLYSEQIRAQQPTPAQRIAQQDASAKRYMDALRRHDAESWLRGRAALRRLPQERRAELLALWNQSMVPAAPHYFLDFLLTHGVTL